MKFDMTEVEFRMLYCNTPNYKTLWDGMQKFSQPSAQHQHETVAWFDSDGKIQGRVSGEQLRVLCLEGLSQLGEKVVPMDDYEKLQHLVTSQGIRLMEYESEQEPVALQMDVIVVNLVREGINKHRARELAEHFIKHTTPPQRTWVGLTEQEHTQIAVEAGCMSADWVFYGALVERKVKEKNT